MRPRPSRLSALLWLGLIHGAQADEGMWLPTQLPDIAGRMQAAGYRGDAAAMADLTAAPLNAVVRVGGGTGAFVSPQGLVLTNHHVAFGVIQYNSGKGRDGVERDLIADGFIAADQASELPASPDFRVRVTTGFERITDRVLAPARGLSGRAYYDAVDAAGKSAVAECEREPGYRCSVANLSYGSDFYLVRQLELQDVRLVYAPPDAIGSYGDEIDNFMWPRHSGDFTLLRAYVGRDGAPAPFSADNVPYAPPSHLQVSTGGVAEGDFAMLAGYPGTTFRHRTAAEFRDQVEWQLPARVELFGALVRLLEEAGAGDRAVATRYASQLASLKNNLKRAQGELDGLRRSDAVAARAREEAAMLDWLRGQPGAAEARRDIDAVDAVLAQARDTRERDQLFALMRSQTQLLRAALQLQRLSVERGKPDAERESGYQQRDEALIEGQLRQLQRRYDAGVEQALLAELLRRHQALPAAQRVPEIEAVFGRGDAETREALARIYAATTLGTEQARLALLSADRAAIAGSDDTLMRAAAALLPAVLRLEDEDKQRAGELLRLRPAYLRTLVAERAARGQPVSPDANGTLRVSYGRVSAMSPRDGVDYRPVTTVSGILEKHTGVAPFDAPAPLRAAIGRGDFGDTADPRLGTQTVNFLTNLDTTGGNSGSPVLDAEQRLVGLNFDSNWESVSASWKFDPRYKRAIHVDMRYLRWLMGEVYPAPHLLREMNLPAD